MKLIDVPFEKLEDEINSSKCHWQVLGSINFEERSTFFAKKILQGISSQTIKNRKISFLEIKLTNPLASHWSILEAIKVEFQSDLTSLATQEKIDFDVKELIYPFENDETESIFNDLSLSANNNSKSRLIIDFSSFPRDMIVQTCNYLFDRGINRLSHRYEEIYLLHVSPEILTSRDGLGPFAVGGLKGLKGSSIMGVNGNARPNLIVFLGAEGFEAKMTIDRFKGDRTNIDIIVDASNDFSSTYTNLIANQAILVDEIEDRVRIHYCYSPSDYLRIFEGIAYNILDTCRRFKNDEHSLIIAPFGPKWSVALSCFAIKRFEDMMDAKLPEIIWSTNILQLKTSQYLSLYSRGFGKSSIFKIEQK